MADGSPQKHGIQAGAEALDGLGEGQSPAQKGVMCDVGAFYNFRVVG